MAMYHGGIAHRGRHTSYGNENIISLSPQLQQLVERNGLHAFISMDNSGQAYLNVQGTRGLASSPAKQYKISQQQMAKLMRSDNHGTLSQNQKAYNTFNSIVKNDFIPPENYIIARNSGINRHGQNMISPVNFGQMGLPVVRRPYGFTEYMGMRTNGQRRPGEAAAIRQLDNGMMAPTAGYIWRGNTQAHQAQLIDQKIDVKPEQIIPQAAPRPEKGQATALIMKGEGLTAGNDTYEMLKDCLNSHGIELREKENQQGQKEYQMVVKPLNAKKNFLYRLSEDEYKLITADHYNDPEHPELSIDKRLEVINGKIKEDFNEPITTDMLKTKDYVDLSYKPGMREKYEADFVAYEKKIQQQQIDEATLAEIRQYVGEDIQRIANDHNAVDGRRITEIMTNAGEGEKAFYQNNHNGRQLYVSEIRADKVDSPEYITALKRYELAKYYGITADMDAQSYAQIKERVNDDYQQLDAKRSKGENLTEEESRKLENLYQLKFELFDKSKGLVNNLDAWLTKPEQKENTPYYSLRANINGEWHEKEISEKEYNRFRDLDDAHKLKMFTDVYKDVKIANGVDDSLAIIRGRDGDLQLKQKGNISESQRTNVNLSILQNMNKSFYAEGKGGREKMVTDIHVAELNKEQLQELEKKLPDSPENRQLLKDLKKQSLESDNLHIMAAVIDGTVVQHAISSKDYDKFMKSNDEQRLKIADKLFDEFKVKLTPEGKQERAAKTRNTVLGVLGAIAGVTTAAFAIKHDIDHFNRHNNGRHHGHYVNTNLPPMPHPHGPSWADAGITKYEILIQDTKETVQSVGRKV